MTVTQECFPEEKMCLEDSRLTNIREPGPHDVMCGRGGGTNNNAGNIKFRQMVNEHKLRYLAASKVDKPKVAREVVKLWRNLSPPGRFLTKSKAAENSKSKDKVWHDVGDQKAREKASQCLRERTPDVLPFVKHLQQHSKQTPESKSTDVPSRRGSNQSATPDKVQSNLADDSSYYDADQLERDVKVQEMELQRLQDLQRQQHQLQMAINNAASASAISSGLMLNSDLLRNTYNDQQFSHPGHVTSSPVAHCSAWDEGSLDEQASARAIALCLFGNKPLKQDKKNEDDDSITQYLKDADSVPSRAEMMDSMSKTSWVKSFQSIESESMSSDSHSLGKIAEEQNGNLKKMPPPAAEAKRSHKMHGARSMASNMSMISEMTDMEGCTGISVNNNNERRTKMKQAGGMNSNISMLSELTDMTGDFTIFSLND